MIEVNLTTTTESNEDEENVCAIEPPTRNRNISRKETELQKQLKGDSLDNLSKLFEKNLLAELLSEDTLMETLRRSIERGDKQGFELWGPYTNPLWNQMAMQDDCILVDNRLAVLLQLRPAVLKRNH